MSTYTHTVNYYETDKMGITHHSNYIRFMEEARMNYLKEIGYPMRSLEASGITSPVVSINCEYRTPTTYADEIEIKTWITGYTGVKLTFGYELKNIETGETVATGSSVHCFWDDSNKPIALRKALPQLDAAFRSCLSKQE